MDYIVLDLEWNQCSRGKEFENKKLPFEIIEIGAVKLDSEFNVKGEFDRIIKPKLYKKLHYIVKNLIDVSGEELREGGDFAGVMREFLDWCGDDYIFCIWGNSDLTELQRNMSFYGIDNTFPMPFRFYDIQKLYSILYEDGKTRRSLQHVTEEMHLNENEEFHRAINDARYTAKVMQRIDIRRAEGFYSIDCYRIPSNKSQEIYAVYDTYEKYISRGFRTKEAAFANRELEVCRCYQCGRECQTVIPWFSVNTRVYYALYRCSEHGYVKTRMRLKKADNGKYYVVRIIKAVDENGAEKIREKQRAIRDKRKEKRRHADDDI